jgi:opacity protein-like surface antigen
VFGLEADVSALDSIGTNTCLAFSGFFLSANCRVRPDLTTTFTARIGYATGPDGRTMFYVKGGLAGMQDKVDIATNPLIGPAFQTNTSLWKWGGTVGAGVEQATGSLELSAGSWQAWPQRCPQR